MERHRFNRLLDKMRLTRCQCLLLVAIVVNLLALYYLAHLQQNLDVQNKFKTREIETEDDPESEQPLPLHKQVTVVIRDFEEFENQVSQTVGFLLALLPELRIVIVADKLPYPPLNLPEAENIHLINLHNYPNVPPESTRPENFVKTNYILLLPDSTLVTSARQIENLVNLLKSFISHSPIRMVAAEVGSNLKPSKHLNLSKRNAGLCMDLSVDLKMWTVKYTPSQQHCSALIGGTYVILMQTQDFFNLTMPFQRPFPHALYIQTALHGWKISVGADFIFQQTKKLFSDAHSFWKRKTHEQNRLRELYSDFGIKKVIHPNNAAEWYGCSKHTARCFGTVVDDTPEYIHQNRWTPPCCLEKIRETARHVFKTLRESGVRYWLEGGSLLGAVRNGDIIPWDYDVDIGIYQLDIVKCNLLSKIEQTSVIDNKGFVWEKSQPEEGNFIRVQYSQSNHLHVDIFPFYSVNGTMTKDYWYKAHRQDTKFPEHYLKPLQIISFVGMDDVSVPNNARAFLEFKFGKGVIENPQYPNPKKVKHKPHLR